MTEIEWRISDEPVAYEAAVAEMEARAEAIHERHASELVWLLEHPPLYTAGTSARPQDLLDPAGLPVHATGRGGQYTYHGPGQRVAYVLLDLSRRGRDLRQYVCDLETWLIRTLARFSLKGERREGRVGIWIAHADGSEHKIAAIGVRVRRWVTFHGIALNVDPDLGRYAGIVPCGIRQHGVTSLVAEGILVSMAEVDAALKAEFAAVFGGL
jgi:lipoyl(octanoyl) transferase